MTSLKKLWKGLALPYIIICLSYLIINSVFLYMNGDLSLVNYLRSIGYMAAGFQSCPHGIGAVAMWFVYTLLIIKILFMVLHDCRWLGVLSVLCILGAFICREHHLAWSVQNVLLALPFYYVGWMLANKKGFEDFTSMLIAFSHHHSIWTIILVVVGLFACYVMGKTNGIAKMYSCNYGNSIILFYVGGFLGSFLIYIVSLLLNEIVLPWVKTISVGSIVILGYQFVPIKLYGFFMTIKQFTPYKYNDLLTLLVSILIMWSFVCIIRIIQRTFPILMGGRSIA